MKNVYALVLITSLFSLNSLGNETEFPAPLPNTMAITLDSAAIVVPMGAASLGSGIRFEYSLIPALSIVVPFEYRYVATSGFDESSKFGILSAGLGVRLYFSHFFWQQPALGGFFVEARAGLGYANETSGMPRTLNNTGAALGLTGTVGYSHAFDFGLVLAGSIAMTGRVFSKSFSISDFIDPLPEVGVSVGWAF